MTEVGEKHRLWVLTQDPTPPPLPWGWQGFWHGLPQHPGIQAGTSQSRWVAPSRLGGVVLYLETIYKGQDLPL